MNATHSSPSPTRRYDLDWLRTLAVLLVLPFHSLLVFVQNPDSVVYMKDTVDCFTCDKIAGFIHQWHMPLLFVIAGMSTAFALGRRSAGQYLVERVQRLLIPLLFGIATVVPAMTYINQVAGGNPIGQGKTLTFWQHYATFFTFGPDLTGRSGTFTPGHLWFILWLVGFSLIGLPLFLLLRAKWNQGVVRGMGWFFGKPMTLLLLGVVLALASSPEMLGELSPIYYFPVFAFGYLLMTDERYQSAIDRDWPVLLLLGVLIELMRQSGRPVYVPDSFPWLMRQLVLELGRWAWVLAILGIGHRLLNRGGKALNYLSEAAYPFYILHFVVLTAVTYFVVKIQAGIPVKYGLIVIVSFAIVFGVYETVRRIAPLRFLLGMKAQKNQVEVVRKEAVARA